MKLTNVIRITTVVAFAATVLVALIGWLVGRDPNALLGVLGAVVAAMGVGEASNVGKRATTKAELMQ